MSEIASASHDSLTGLLSRSGFIDAMVAAIGSGPHPVGAVFLDLRRFAMINDALGPATGDELLRKFARRLSGVVPGALCGRISGDAFALLLPEGTQLEQSVSDLLDLCARPFMVGGHVLTISSHLGAARTGPGIADGYDLLQATDLALHDCISRGDRAAFYTPEMKRSASRAFLIERDLRASVLIEQRRLATSTDSESFALEFQPKIGAADARLHGFEALLRWTMNDGTQVPPSEFVPIAEHAGFMDVIGAWALRAACAALSRWPEHVSLAVNVAPCQLRNPDWLLAQLDDAVDAFGIAPKRLEVEITEAALAGRQGDVVAEFVERGHKVWIDDFGTEYSTLARLCSLPFTGLKIDKSVADGLSRTGPDTAFRLLSAICSISAALGLDTVIEGIETEWQAARVRDAGIDTIQGYLYAPPLTLQAATDFALSHSTSKGAACA